MPPLEQTEPYIPDTDIGLKIFLENFSTVIAADPAKYFLTQADSDLITDVYLSYASALTAATMPGTRNATTVAAKDSQRASAEATVRPICQILKSNQAIDNEDKILLGLHIDDTRSPIPAPNSAPILSLGASFSGQHEIRFVDENTPTRKAKPDGVSDMELWVYVGPSATADWQQAKYIGKYTKNPINHTFMPDQAGQVATYFGRWSTQRGLTGPWSLPVAMGIAFGGPVDQQMPTGGTEMESGGDGLSLAA